MKAKSIFIGYFILYKIKLVGQKGVLPSLMSASETGEVIHLLFHKHSGQKYLFTTLFVLKTSSCMCMFSKDLFRRV